MSTYMIAYNRAERVRFMVLDRMRSTALEAGLSPEYPALHAHNAMISYRDGHPWKGVNYALARKILWLESRLFLGHEILKRWALKRSK